MNSYGSIRGALLTNDRIIRDHWIKEQRQFKVLANAWKETLRDSFSDIKAYYEASKKQVRKMLYKQITNEEHRAEFYKKLKSNDWVTNKYLRRLLRKHWKHGRNHTHNQIVVRSDDYTTFQLGGRTWIKIPSLQKGIRLILRAGIVEVHYTIEVEETENCGSATIGIDKGYTEVFVDSEGTHYGEGLGKILSTQSDKLNQIS